jgi:hypothetical protein
MTVVKMGEVASTEWWSALERLVSALEPDSAGALSHTEKLNKALHELRRHARRAAQADAKARLVGRLLRALA